MAGDWPRHTGSRSLTGFSIPMPLKQMRKVIWQPCRPSPRQSNCLTCSPSTGDVRSAVPQPRLHRKSMADGRCVMSSPQPRLPGSFHALCTELTAGAFPDATSMTTARYALQVVAAVGRAQRRSLPLKAITDLAGADLSGAHLTGADLTSANLAHTDLTDANLTGADLGANLAGANLASARLTRADLAGANLTGADLTFAKLIRAIWPALPDRRVLGRCGPNRRAPVSRRPDRRGSDARAPGRRGPDRRGPGGALTGARLGGADLASAPGRRGPARRRLDRRAPRRRGPGRREPG